MKTPHGRHALKASSHFQLGQTRKLPGSQHEKWAYLARLICFRWLISLPCAALLLFSAISADAKTLKLTTWNLEWLTAKPAGDPELPQDVTPKRAEDVASLARYAERVASDVIAIQEVDGPEIAARVFPPDRYVIHMTRDRVVQRVGLVVRRGIDFVVNPDLVALVPAPTAHHPLRSGADITLQLPGGFLRILAVHLKTGCREEPLSRSSRPSCEVLRQQVPALQGWIDTVYHRLPLLSPTTQLIGYGQQISGGTAINVIDSSGRNGLKSDPIIVWPWPGQHNVAASWNGLEGPTPPAPPSGFPSGPVVTAQFWTAMTVTSHQLTDAGGNAIAHTWLDQKSDPNLANLAPETVGLYANKPLANGTYAVSLTLSTGDVLAWRFTVGN